MTTPNNSAEREAAYRKSRCYLSIDFDSLDKYNRDIWNEAWEAARAASEHTETATNTPIGYANPDSISKLFDPAYDAVTLTLDKTRNDFATMAVYSATAQPVPAADVPKVQDREAVYRKHYCQQGGTNRYVLAGTACVFCEIVASSVVAVEPALSEQDAANALDISYMSGFHEGKKLVQPVEQTALTDERILEIASCLLLDKLYVNELQVRRQIVDTGSIWVTQDVLAIVRAVLAEVAK